MVRWQVAGVGPVRVFWSGWLLGLVCTFATAVSAPNTPLVVPTVLCDGRDCTGRTSRFLQHAVSSQETCLEVVLKQSSTVVGHSPAAKAVLFAQGWVADAGGDLSKREARRIDAIVSNDQLYLSTPFSAPFSGHAQFELTGCDNPSASVEFPQTRRLKHAPDAGGSAVADEHLGPLGSSSAVTQELCARERLPLGNLSPTAVDDILRFTRVRRRSFVVDIGFGAGSPLLNALVRAGVEGVLGITTDVLNHRQACLGLETLEAPDCRAAQDDWRTEVTLESSQDILGVDVSSLRKASHVFISASLSEEMISDATLNLISGLPDGAKVVSFHELRAFVSVAGEPLLASVLNPSFVNRLGLVATGKAKTSLFKDVAYYIYIVGATSSSRQDLYQWDEVVQRSLHATVEPEDRRHAGAVQRFWHGQETRKHQGNASDGSVCSLRMGRRSHNDFTWFGRQQAVPQSAVFQTNDATVRIQSSGADRDSFLRVFGFATLLSTTLRSLAHIMQPASWLSLGSGNGHLEEYLKHLGVQIVATDSGVLYSVAMSHVILMNATASVQRFGSGVQGLFFSWPSLDEEWAANALLEYQRANRVMPATVILIGDEAIVGDSDFFQILSDHYTVSQTLPTLRWRGSVSWVKDAVHVFRRK